MDFSSEDLQFQALHDDYAHGRRRPIDVLRRAHARALGAAAGHAWITLLDWERIASQQRDADVRRAAGQALPLYGVPFAVKDNIDVQGVLTTAACPGYARVAAASAAVVDALCRAGAIVLGKTNLDQFATGLVGTRSPYGACSSAFDPRDISGGSSSGSALAVALGQVSFALGTDTAGSGRVPAALNNIVGLKPTRGWLSTRGVVPACRSLDCVSVFAGNVADGWRVLEIASGFDVADPFSRAAPPGTSALSVPGFRFGVPARSGLEFFGDAGAERVFHAAVQQLERLGGQPVEIDFAPFRRTAELLYHGPWLAERAVAFGEFVAHDAPGVDPTVAAIVRGADRQTAADGFRAQYRLQELAREVSGLWRELDVLVVPTTPTSYTHEQIAESPVELNARLGIYTNFTNLLDLCGVAVPAGFRAPQRPFGVTLLGPAFSDRALMLLAGRLHQSEPRSVGATATPVLPAPSESPLAPRRATLEVAPVARVRQSIRLAVVGAHLSGQPLHRELVELGARLEQSTHSAPSYRLFALAGTVPPKPGLVRVSTGGIAIELEVYRLDAAGFGQFVAAVGAPLGIGNVELASGEWVKGFLCEPIATEGATEISHFGGWRAYLAGRS
ncbi:MAG: allophanate hydrolase [Deltaproteobacteria bacterium]